MRFCKKCGRSIDHLHTNAVRCKTCQIKHRLLYERKRIKRRDLKNPLAARGGPYRAYWNFLMSLKLEELSALYHTKQIALKTHWGNERQFINTQIKLIVDVYKRKAPKNYPIIEEVNPDDKSTEEAE